MGPGVVMVGAFGVGRMTSHHADIVTNSSRNAAQGDLETGVTRGEELGRFELGSTVILLIEPCDFSWELTPGQPVRLGRPIGRFNP